MELCGKKHKDMPSLDTEEDAKEYYVYLADQNNLVVTTTCSFLFLILIVLKDHLRGPDNIPDWMRYGRAVGGVSLCAYMITLYRVKNGTSNSIRLKWWGNFVILQRAVIGCSWIYLLMKSKEGAEIQADTVIECLVSIGMLVIFPVHSSWTAVVVVLSEIMFLCHGAIGSPLSTFVNIAILCLLVSCITFVTEFLQIVAFQTYLENKLLLLQLERKNEEMRSLIGNVAHDLKTPLQAFVSELENISDDSAGTRDSLRGIADFMAMMINRSIDFTKVQSGYSLKPSLETVNISNCIDWVISTIVHTGKADAVTITAELDLNLAHGWIITDKHWLMENLLCYMSNAVKFVAEGSIAVKASVEYEDKEDNEQSRLSSPNVSNRIWSPRTKASAPISPLSNNSFETDIEQNQSGTTPARVIKFIRFSVTDTGIGIAKEKRDRLFSPFFQAQTGAGGTGLGLYALSKRIEAMGGKYGVSEREDGASGCSFWFSVPYRPDTEVSEDHVMTFNQTKTVSSRVPPLSQSTCNAFVFRRGDTDKLLLEEAIKKTELGNSKPLPRVLLVDDSNMIQKASTRALQREGFRVSNAYNGVECLKLLKEAKASGDPYVMVLLDLQMPVLDGLETVKRIRAEEKLIALESGQGKDYIEEDSRKFPTVRAQCTKSRQYVIGLSANSDPESIGGAAAAGMDNFIAKPLKVQNLRKFCETQIDI